METRLKRPRRDNGDGWIGKRMVAGKQAGWMALLDCGRDPATGKRLRKGFYAPTKEEVKAKLKAAQRAQERGHNVIGPKPTVAQWIERWIAAKFNLRPSAMRSARGLLLNHVSPTLGHIRLEKLTPTDVEQMLKAKLESGLSAQTVLHLRNMLGNVLRQAERDGLVERNVARLASAPHVEQRDVPVLTPEQAVAMQRAVKDDRLGALYVLALRTGLRQGELLGLRWEDVDLDAGTLRVSQALQRIKGKGLQRVEVKTKFSRETVTIGTVGSQILREHRARHGAIAGYVFTSERAKPLDGPWVTKHFQALLAAANLPQMRFHDLRHANLSFLFASMTMTPQEVAKSARHSSTRLVFERYGHAIPSTQSKAADAMDRVLGG